MNLDEHFRKDIRYHATTAHEYDRVVVEPRECLNEILFGELLHRIAPGGRMLDLGCGTGHGIRRFGSRFLNVVGVDHSREMLTRAVGNLEQFGIRNATLLNQDVFSFIESVVTPFQFICSVGFLHHLPPASIRPLLTRLSGLLAPAGQLLIADPIEVDLSSMPGAIEEWNARSVMTRRAFTDPGEEADEAPLDYDGLKADLAASGFSIDHEVRSWELFPHHLPASGADRDSIRNLHDRYGASGNVLFLLCSKQ